MNVPGELTTPSSQFWHLEVTQIFSVTNSGALILCTTPLHLTLGCDCVPNSQALQDFVHFTSLHCDPCWNPESRNRDCLDRVTRIPLHRMTPMNIDISGPWAVDTSYFSSPKRLSPC
jgi:hypothetical protein